MPPGHGTAIAGPALLRGVQRRCQTRPKQTRSGRGAKAVSSIGTSASTFKLAGGARTLPAQRGLWTTSSPALPSPPEDPTKARKVTVRSRTIATSESAPTSTPRTWVPPSYLSWTPQIQRFVAVDVLLAASLGDAPIALRNGARHCAWRPLISRCRHPRALGARGRRLSTAFGPWGSCRLGT